MRTCETPIEGSWSYEADLGVAPEPAAEPALELRPPPGPSTAASRAPTNAAPRSLARPRSGAVSGMTVGLVIVALVWVGLTLLVFGNVLAAPRATQLGLAALGAWLTAAGIAYVLSPPRSARVAR